MQPNFVVENWSEYTGRLGEARAVTTNPLGWMVELHAEPDKEAGYSFLHWWAADSMAHGNREENAEFMLMGNVTAWAASSP